MSRRTGHALVDFNNLAKCLAGWHSHTFDTAWLSSYFGGARAPNFAHPSCVAQEAASGVAQRAQQAELAVSATIQDSLAALLSGKHEQDVSCFAVSAKHVARPHEKLPGYNRRPR